MFLSEELARRLQEVENAEAAAASSRSDPRQAQPQNPIGPRNNRDKKVIFFKNLIFFQSLIFSAQFYETSLYLQHNFVTSSMQLFQVPDHSNVIFCDTLFIMIFLNTRFSWRKSNNIKTFVSI